MVWLAECSTYWSGGINVVHLTFKLVIMRNDNKYYAMSNQYFTSQVKQVVSAQQQGTEMFATLLGS